MPEAFPHLLPRWSEAVPSTFSIIVTSVTERISGEL